MHLLDKVLQLVYDSEINVKCFGIELIFKISPYLSAEERKNRICKIFLELLSNPKEDVQIKMSSMIGQIFNQLEIYLTKNQASVSTIVSTFKVTCLVFLGNNLIHNLCFFFFFKDYGAHKNPKLRINFAFNFPAILFLTDSKSTFDKLRSTYLSLLLKDDC